MVLKLIVFGGWFGSGNIGDDAILLGIKNIFTKFSPDLDIVALSTNPLITEKVCEVESILLKSPLNLLSKRSIYFNNIKKIDACIISGGTPIYDYGHISRFIHMTLPKILNKKLFCYGIGAKNLTSTIGRIILKTLLGNVCRISTRDRPSQKTLTTLGLDSVRLTGDSAFFLERENFSRLDQIFIRNGLDIDTPTVAICPRILSKKFEEHYHDYVSLQKIEEIVHLLADAADYLSSLGYQVAFIPMHRYGFDSDLPAIFDVIAAMDYRAPKIILSELSPCEALSIMGRMELVIGLRLHSLIFAASMGVPFLSINYDRKIEGLLDLLKLNRYLCSTSCSYANLRDKMDEVLDNRLEISRSLHKSCKDIKKKIIREAGQIVKSITNQ